MPLLGARADTTMEISSLSSLTKLASSFTRWNKYLTASRTLSSNHFNPLKTELKMLIWIELVNVPYFFMFPEEWVNPPETLAVKQSFSAPPYLSKDIHTVLLFLLFVLFFPFFPPFPPFLFSFLSFTFNESPGCSRRRKGSEQWNHL